MDFVLSPISLLSFMLYQIYDNDKVSLSAWNYCETAFHACGDPAPSTHLAPQGSQEAVATFTEEPETRGLYKTLEPQNPRDTHISSLISFEEFGYFSSTSLWSVVSACFNVSSNACGSVRERPVSPGLHITCALYMLRHPLGTPLWIGRRGARTEVPPRIDEILSTGDKAANLHEAIRGTPWARPLHLTKVLIRSR